MTRRRRRNCPRPLALLLLLAAARADSAEPPASPQSTPAESSAPSAEALRYRVAVDAPAALRDVLAASIDLIRWQTYEEMTASLFDTLARKAVDQAKEAAATEGFFAADVGLHVERDARPMSVTLRVAPGTQARVT